MKLYLLIILVMLTLALTNFSCSGGGKKGVGFGCVKKGCSIGETCNENTGKCEIDGVEDCTKEDCLFGYECNTETKKCEKFKDCTTNGCPEDKNCNPISKKCEDNQNIGTGCIYHNDCGYETEYCVSGHCKKKPLLINEYMVENDKFTYFKDSSWVEIYNTTDKAINLAGYHICNVLKSTYSPVPESCAKIPDTSKEKTTVAAKGFILFYYDNEEGALHIDDRISNSTGGDISLFLLASDKESLIDKITQVGILGEGNNKLQKNMSSGRIDQGETWGKMTEPTPGAVNKGGRSWESL